MSANRLLITHLVVLVTFTYCYGDRILMVTMGGTKSHKIPFWELARGLGARGHNITFISAFPPDFSIPGLEEITPTRLVFYVKNFTNWDLVGRKFQGQDAVHPFDMFRYAIESCEMLLSDPETHEFLHLYPHFDLIILDGAYPECALGFVHYYNAPFMYINTVAFYTGSLTLAGNPTPYAATPFLTQPFTDNMGLIQRITNVFWYLLANFAHSVVMRTKVQPIVRKYFGRDVPAAYDMSTNVSFILQNAHATVTYPRAYLPNVAEIACIHCKAAKPLSDDLESFIRRFGDNGFIYFSMGSSVRAANMPDYMRKMLLRSFQRLPYGVLWKYEADGDMIDLPPNVKLSRWLPQQDLLGHSKIRAFVNHAGLHSMLETVYHGVPIVALPVFCDHESNAAKAEVDGYALVLDFHNLTTQSLVWAIHRVIEDPVYRDNARRRQTLLRDQKETPLERAVYWTEYVLRHRGAKHLQSPVRNLTFAQYFLLDCFITVAIAIWLCCAIIRWLCKIFVQSLYRVEMHKHPKKLD